MNNPYPQQPQQPNWGQQPTQPGYGYPHQPYGQPPYQPQPPKKRKTGKILGITAAVFAGLAIIGAIAGGGDNSAKDASNKDQAAAVTSDKPKAAAEEPAADDKPAKEEPAAEDKSQAEQFKECVNKSGTATEKTAVRHVTKVTGADKNNDILDAAEVFTDYKGGFLSENAGDAKLLASAFASCYESDNGLVTIYGSDGDMISNGNY